MRVLVLSTYELGHQPIGLATAAGLLRRAEHEVRTCDLSIDQLADADLAWAEAVVVSVPMHTALRLALAAVERIRRQSPKLPIALIGLYAHVASGSDLLRGGDLLATGEFAPHLLSWLAEGTRPVEAGPRIVTDLGPPRTRPLPVDRSGLAELGRYAYLVSAEGSKKAAYVETTRGCSHLCRHCPVPVVYRGRTRVVDLEAVLDDIGQQVAMGARHLTFGDPDFLNRPEHAQRVVRSLHATWPDLTFDVTVKVEHILRHERLWAELATAGCLFVVSAVESVDDEVLEHLDKGHTTVDTVRAIGVLRSCGIEFRPSLLPFTPWTTLEGFAELVSFVAAHDLVESVDPVQYGIRLLLPPGSLLLKTPDPVLAASLSGYDAAALTWTWRSADQRVDRLQAEVAALTEAAASNGEPCRRTYRDVRRAAFAALGRDDPSPPAVDTDDNEPPVRPHLSEPWFCCAEPTNYQLAAVNR